MALAMFGQGAFADLLAGELKAVGIADLDGVQAGAGAGAALPFLVWARDGRDWTHDLDVQHALRETSLPWLSVWRNDDEVWIGPLQRGSQPGCLACLRHRLRCASQDRTAFDVHDQQRVLAWSGPLPPLALPVITSLIQEEQTRLKTNRSPRTREAVFAYSLRTGAMKQHPLVPYGLCTECSDAGQPAAEIAAAADRPLHKLSPDTFRTAAPPDADRLRRRFVDHRTGVILNEVRHPHQSWLPVSEAKLVLSHTASREPGLGREFDYGTAARVAVLEALERHAGLEPHSGVSVVEASHASLATAAIDPVSLTLHDPAAYADPRLQLTAYSPDLRLRWVWAHSFRQGGPCLVPEQAVYYGVTPGRRDPHILRETSSGCALGGSREEAVFHGLLEFIERDAFLLMWYGQVPAPRLDIRAVTDLRLRDLVDRVERQGYVVDAFNITSDVGLPVVAVLVWNTDENGPFLSLSAGAHPNPLQAYKSALMEAAWLLPSMGELRARFRGDHTLLDGENVRSLDDHRALYLMPESRERLAFLLRPGRVQGFAEAWGPHPWPHHADLRDDLNHLVNRVLAAGLDVLAVDQTPPELSEVGLHAARVLVPGALPMTFGHKLRRVERRRLETALPRMGYQVPAQLNPYPHPFC
ncbi:MAG: bacteriocin biosynthesis protein SagD [Firmicutes bacterium]|nr:bacteriocin biosynthesis protein SagD [Bacillota bacterium]